MDEVQEQFEDPALGGAIRRACGKPPAPWGLRDKVAAMMASSVPAQAAATGRSSSRWRLFSARLSGKLVAAAAVAFLAIGVAGMQIYDFVAETYFSSGPPQPITFSDSLATSMLAAHRNCARLADHHIVPGNDFGALRTQLSTSIGINIYADALGNGWQFKGAGLCKVGEVNAAHLLFTRGEEEVSIFSLPMEHVACLPAMYAQTVERDALAGFTEGNGLYVVVESRAGGKPAELTKAQSVMRIVQNHMCSSACSTQAAPAPKS